MIIFILALLTLLGVGCDSTLPTGSFLNTPTSTVATSTPIPTALQYISLWPVTDKYDVKFSNCASTLVGSGLGNCLLRKWEVATSTTANSSAYIFLDTQNSTSAGLSAGQLQTVIDWRKPVAILYKLSVTNSTSTGSCQSFIGKLYSDGLGSPIRQGLGFKINNLSLVGIAHNGTTLTTTATIANFTNNVVYFVGIYSDGNGNVYWYSSSGNGLGAALATTTYGPKLLGTAAQNAITWEAQNGADAADQRCPIFLQRIYIGQ